MHIASCNWRGVTIGSLIIVGVKKVKMLSVDANEVGVLERCSFYVVSVPRCIVFNIIFCSLAFRSGNVGRIVCK